jgi:thiosulfate/3-mercaptopyruvate sulfurtransferase
MSVRDRDLGERKSLERKLNMKAKMSFSASGTVRILSAILIVMCCVVVALVWAGRASGNRSGGNSAAARATELWTDAQTVQPAELVKELGAKGKNRPVVVCAGFSTLYEGAHVPGAVFHGPASQPEGLADLKKWAEGIPRSSNLVVYCGCCPFAKCPNIRPAFEALRAMGFQHLRVLVLPDNFYKDGYSKGYPVEKGK